MKTKLYAIRDIQANRSMNPIARESDEIAIRDFTRMVSAVPTPENPFASTPEDFTLYRVGEWDDEMGRLTERDPYRLINGKEACTTDQRDEAIRAFEAKLNETLQTITEVQLAIQERLEQIEPKTNRVYEYYELAMNGADT